MRYIVLKLIMIIIFSTPAWGDESSHRQLAAEFVAITKTAEVADLMMKQGLMAGLVNVPNKEQYQDIIEDVVKRYLSFKRVEDAYIDYHTTIFTEEELRDIVAFCKTPSGKKYIARSANLNGYLMQLMAPLMQEATPELIRRMQARTKELQKENAE